MFADYIILQTEKPKDTTRKLLEFINEFGKVVEFKINKHKSALFLYTNNELSEREIKKQSIYHYIKKIPRSKPT